MALAPVTIAVLLAGIPYHHGPGQIASLAPWRYFILGLGLAVAASALVGAVASD